GDHRVGLQQQVVAEGHVGVDDVAHVPQRRVVRVRVTGGRHDGGDLHAVARHVAHQVGEDARRGDDAQLAVVPSGAGTGADGTASRQDQGGGRGGTDGEPPPLPPRPHRRHACACRRRATTTRAAPVRTSPTATAIGAATVEPVLASRSSCSSLRSHSAPDAVLPTYVVFVVMPELSPTENLSVAVSEAVPPALSRTDWVIVTE